ncbi:MAG TPA: electron transfer flavoprotein subunit alpha/FixB family protein [Candidatus Dormibacteraeota bacterium]|nr:electron transfer flavoprotein subunit alpha/FixB family protein [Candidatus Dormibacteraeota bacterium]
MSTVWAYCERDAEVMGDAADLAEELDASAAAIAAGADPGVLAAAGAERVLLLDAPYDAEAHATAIAGAVGDTAAALLLSGTANGADLAPRLAAALGAACLLDCAWLRADPAGTGLLAARWAHDDRVQERWHVPAGLPLVATVRHGARGAPRPRPRQAEVTPLAAGQPRVRRMRRLAHDPRSVRLAEAERIVAAGLGIGSPDLLPAIQELADLLDAALGASRPVADRGWVPFERQIGTTGQLVEPRLYVAIGISGASQHLGGIREADTIVAINTDPACPMMARATLAAVGDAGEVVAALTAALRAGTPA